MILSPAIMRPWAGAAGLVTLFGVVALMSCRQIIGIPSADPTNACGLAYGTSACASCASTSCCAESNTCAADSLFCGPYETCLDACNGDAACRSKCTIDNPVPAGNAAPVSALSACLASKCESECGLSCGGFAGYLSMPDASAACQSCIEKGSACTDSRSCATSAACDGFWRSYLSCATPDCQWNSVAANDAGVSLFRPLYQDFAGACSGACGYGSYWACAGHVSWPNAKSTTVRNRWWVYDWQSGMGVAGATVSICVAGNSPGCPCPTSTNRVVAQGQTDSNGYIDLTWQQDLTTTGGGASVCSQTTAPGYLTTMNTDGFPDTQPVINQWDTLIPPRTWGTALLTPDAQALNVMGNGAASDPTVAPAVGAQVVDCLGSPASGAQVSITGPPPVDDAIDGGPASGAIVLYGADAGPDAATSALTIGGGIAYFLDVPPGSITLTATVPGIGVVSKVSFTAAANTVTGIAMPPTP